MIFSANERAVVAIPVRRENNRVSRGLQYMAPLLLETATNGSVSERLGKCSQYAAPHGVYSCRPKHTDDRLVLIAIHSDDEWVRFCEEIGNPEWTKRPEFSTRRDRRHNRQERDTLIEK